MKQIMIIIGILFTCSCTSVESKVTHHIPQCNEKTVYEQLDCLENSLEIKTQILDNLNNKSTPDYKIWKEKVTYECETINSNTLGEAISEGLDCKHRLYDERINTLKKQNNNSSRLKMLRGNK